MCSIILIATGHRENGLCNSSELLKVIEEINPDVIFEEVPPGKFHMLYAGQLQDSLESFTIKEYLKTRSIPHIPVDLDLNESFGINFRMDVKQMDDVIEYYSPQCSHLMNLHASNAARYGFPYLNSQRCNTLLEKRHQLEDMAIRNINKAELLATHNKWLEFLAVREKEMIRNIYDFSANNRYEKGLFLVGAEHRKPIMNRIPEFEKNPKQKINWIFNYFSQL